MEKLHSDMLEMILSQPLKRLNERQTKFLVYQVNLIVDYLSIATKVYKKMSCLFLFSRCWLLYDTYIVNRSFIAI